MTTFTIPGVAPDPNAHGRRPFGQVLSFATKPIFSRPKRRPLIDSEPSVVSPMSPSFRPFEPHELQFLRGVPDEDVTILPVFEAPLPYFVPVRSWRRRMVRFFGTLLIGAAFYVCFGILRNSQVQDAVLQWVTMGHEGEFKAAASQVNAGIDWGRQQYDQLNSRAAK